MELILKCKFYNFETELELGNKEYVSINKKWCVYFLQNCDNILEIIKIIDNVHINL